MKLKKEAQDLAEQVFDLEAMNEALKSKIAKFNNFAIPKKLTNSCV